MTGRDLVAASLRLIGASAPGESISADEATDGLAAINRMLDSWSNEGLIIFQITEESPITLSAGDGSYTLGTAGYLTTRPMSIERAMIRSGSTDYPVNLLSLEEFASIVNKGVQSTLPHALYDDGGYPQRTIKLYPVPSAGNQLILFTKRPITQISTLDSTLSYPPGYERALVFNGAIELAPEYGRPVTPEIAQIAMEAKANIKRANKRSYYLRCDEAIVNRKYMDFESGERR